MDEEGNSSNAAESVVPRQVCVQFQKWGSCGSGERCRFYHDTTSGSSMYGPSQSIGVRQGKGEYRESDAITIVTTPGHEARKKTHSDKLVEANTPLSDRLERFRSVDLRNKLKIRLCTKWERTRTCAYGSLCTFAHGIAELQSVGSFNPQQLEISAGISAPANSLAPNAIGSSAPPKKKLFNWDVYKISQVYGDWIEPPPPPP